MLLEKVVTAKEEDINTAVQWEGSSTNGSGQHSFRNLDRSERRLSECTTPKQCQLSSSKGCGDISGLAALVKTLANTMYPSEAPLSDLYNFFNTATTTPPTSGAEPRLAATDRRFISRRVSSADISVDKVNALKNYLHPDCQPETNDVYDILQSGSAETCEATRGGSWASDASERTALDFCSVVKGTYFRACVRPPSVQDKHLERMRFLYQATILAKCTLLALCLAAQVIVQNLTWDRQITEPYNWFLILSVPGLVVALRSSVAHFRIGVLSIVVTLTSNYVMNSWLRSAAGNSFALRDLFPVASTVVAAAIVLWFRRQRVARAMKVVQQDRQAFDSAWTALLQDAVNSKAVMFLSHLPDSDLDTVKQVVTIPSREASRGECTQQSFRVRSLDQLHQQSMLLQPLLRQQAQSWASKANGYFRLKPRSESVSSESLETEPEFVRWSELSSDPHASRSVAWATSKGFKRSCKKVQDVYNSCVWRLCDVTREAIFFENLADLQVCLSAISEDVSVDVKGVKNALGKMNSYDGAGFRFVKLQLCLRLSETSELGLEDHVCELLLIPIAMEKCKMKLEGEGGRVRYLHWRTEMAAAGGITSMGRKRLMRLIAGGSSATLRASSRGHRWPVQMAMTRTKSMPAAEELVREASQSSATEEVQRRRQFSSGLMLVTRGSSDAALPDACIAAMKTHLWASNTNVGGLLGRRAERVAEAIASTANSTSFRMKQPIASALARGRFQAILLVAGVFMTALNVAGVSSVVSGTEGLRVGRTFRFQHLEACNGEAGLSPAIAGFAMLKDGRQAEALPVSTTVEGRSMRIELDREVEFNGWTLSTLPDGPAEESPARFRLEMLEGGSWEVVGASSWFKEVGWPMVFLDSPLDTPLPGRGATLEFRMHDGDYAFMLPLGGLLVGLTMCAAAVCGYEERVMLGVVLIKTGVCAAMVVHVTAAWLLRRNGAWREAMFVSAWAGSSLLWVTTVHVAPMLVLEAFMGAGVVNCVATWIVRTRLYGLTGVQAVDSVGAMYIAIGVTCKAMVLFNEWRVAVAFRYDVQTYEWAWELLQNEDKATGVLDALKAVTDAVDNLDARQPCQRMLPYPRELDHDPDSLDALWWSGCSMPDSERGYSLSPRTQSIDQLYAQAEVSAVVLRDKVLDWAAASGGRFLTSNGMNGLGLRRAVSATELIPSEMEALVQSTIKKAQRALEKTFRCYGGDFSKLMDISRHSMVFETMDDLLKCFEIVRDDPDVRILRVKNDLHASQSCPSGYRHVLINLQVVSPLTESMGVSNHISELQFMYLPFALAKTAEGHQRYVAARNARGE